MNEIELQLIEKLNTAVRTFKEAGIEFVVIGGLAMIAHGSSNVTRDADLAYALDPDNLERLAAFLPTIHARVLGRPKSEHFAITPATLQRVRFLNLDTDLGAVDILRDIPGMDSFEGLAQRAVHTDFGGFTVRVASLNDLISMKQAANRPKDQGHLYELLALKKIIEAHQTP